MMNEFLRRVVGLNWSAQPYRSVVWVDDADEIASAALAAGCLEEIVREPGGVLARITEGGLAIIGVTLPWVSLAGKRRAA